MKTQFIKNRLTHTLNERPAQIMVGLLLSISGYDGEPCSVVEQFPESIKDHYHSIYFQEAAESALRDAGVVKASSHRSYNTHVVTITKENGDKEVYYYYLPYISMRNLSFQARTTVLHH